MNKQHYHTTCSINECNKNKNNCTYTFSEDVHVNISRKYQEMHLCLSDYTIVFICKSNTLGSIICTYLDLAIFFQVLQQNGCNVILKGQEICSYTRTLREVPTSRITSFYRSSFYTLQYKLQTQKKYQVFMNVF